MSLTPATTAGRRPALLRSVPFWILLVGSLASAVAGIWIVLDKIGTMTSTLADGSATGVEVYGGQSWVIVGGAFLAAGLFGLVITLALAVARSFVPTPAVEVVEAIEWTTVDDEDDEPAVVLVDEAVPSSAPEPTPAAHGEPVVDDAPAATPTR